MEYTSTPWVFEIEESHVGGHHRYVCSIITYKYPNKRGIKFIADCGEYTNENEANARLIAKAPYLVEVLREISEIDQPDPVNAIDLAKDIARTALQAVQ